MLDKQGASCDWAQDAIRDGIGRDEGRDGGDATRAAVFFVVVSSMRLYLYHLRLYIYHSLLAFLLFISSLISISIIVQSIQFI